MGIFLGNLFTFYNLMNVKDLREKYGLTQAELSENTGIPRDRIAKWEQGKGSPKSKDEKVLILFFGKLREQVPHESPPTIEDSGDHSTYQKKRLHLKNHTSKRQRIPFFDTEAHAGLTETEMTAIHAPAGTIDIGDLLHDSHAAIRIYGNSMLPNYPPGCVVGLAKCESKFIEPGEVYVIETRDRRVLKRLFYKDDQPESDSFLCYSDNIMRFEGGSRDGKLAYPPYHLKKSEIINLFIVTGVIKRNANSVIINR